MTRARTPTLKKMKVCEICGDVGYKKCLMYCVKCEIAAIHRYCVPGPNLIDDDEKLDWVCEDCVPKKRKKRASRKSERVMSNIARKAIQRQERQKCLEALKSTRTKQVESLNEVPREDINHDQENKKDFYDLEQDEEKKQSEHLTSTIQSNKFSLHNANEDLNIHTEGRTCRANTTTLSQSSKLTGAKRKPLSEYQENNLVHNLCTPVKDFVTKGDLKTKLKDDTYSHGNGFHIKRRKIIMDSSDDELDQIDHVPLSELFKFSMSTQPQVKKPIKESYDRTSQSSVTKNNNTGSVRPILDAVWRGYLVMNFNFGELSCKLEAHLSNRCTQIVHGAASALGEFVNFKLVSKKAVWLKRFEKAPPTSNDIDLYMLPMEKRDEIIYSKLLEEMIEGNGFLSSTINTNLEILIFPSTELPEHQRRISEKYYMWSIFKMPNDEYSYTPEFNVAQLRNIKLFKLFANNTRKYSNGQTSLGSEPILPPSQGHMSTRLKSQAPNGLGGDLPHSCFKLDCKKAFFSKVKSDVVTQNFEPGIIIKDKSYYSSDSGSEVSQVLSY